MTGEQVHFNQLLSLFSLHSLEKYVATQSQNDACGIGE
jgi:hypothetical protein